MDYRELEETLARLPSVNAVRITGDRSHITEIHVLASPDKAAKQVVRDVQTLVLARFGIDLDRRVISVVQIGPNGARSDQDRPIIIGINEVPAGPRTTVSVALRWHNQEYTGSATGPAAASARTRLVGEAALRAVEEIVGTEALALDAVGAPAIGMRRVMVVVVVGTGATGEEVTVGSALSHGDDSEATVRAVLDALNRRIGRPD